MAHSYKTHIEGEKSSSSRNAVDFIRTRERGCTRNEKIQLNIDEYRVEMMNPGRKEMKIGFNSIDKVLCSEWINHRKIICGTGCGKVILYDVNNRNSEQVPTMAIDGSGEVITCIEMNPNKHLLAMCKQCTESRRRLITVYNLPSLDAVCGNIDVYTGTVQFPFLVNKFKLCWLNNSILIESAYSPTLKFWKMSDVTQKLDLHKLFKSKYASKICNTSVNLHTQDICALSTNGDITFLDANTLTEVSHYDKIPKEVFRHIVVNERHSYFITASKDTIFIVKKDNGCVHTLPIPNCGEENWIFSIRSVEDLLTVGTKNGEIYKIDLRQIKVEKYSPEILCRASRFEGSNLYMYADRGGYHRESWMPSIFTHSYDPSGTRLFTGGGYFCWARIGYYSALWQ